MIQLAEPWVVGYLFVFVVIITAMDAPDTCLRTLFENSKAKGPETTIIRK